MQMKEAIAMAIVIFGVPCATTADAGGVPTVPEGYVLTQVATGLNGITSIYRDPLGRFRRGTGEIRRDQGVPVCLRLRRHEGDRTACR